jgi:hypothetical protein
MSTPAIFPKVSKDIHPEVKRHLDLLYQATANHYRAFQEQAAQITALQAQVKALQGK